MSPRPKRTTKGAPLGIERLAPPQDPAGLSLDQLSEAFVNLLSQGEDPFQGPARAPETAEEELAEQVQGGGLAAEDDDDGEVSPSSILEAMLFVGTPDNRPLTSETVASLMRGVRAAEVDQLVRDLNARYAADGCPYEIVSTGPGYTLTLRRPFERIRDKLYSRTRQGSLSQASIDVLAIVAYYQPVTADELSALRGHPSRPILTQLVRRELLRLERSEEKPRQPRYYTTQRFLRLFGLNSLDDLPRSPDLDRT